METIKPSGINTQKKRKAKNEVYLIKSIEFSHLSDFIKVDDAGGIERAAAQLDFSQPNLSKKIQQLEKRLGVTLLDRDCRPYKPNQVGRAFLEDARDIHKKFQQAVEKAQRIQRGELGCLVVSFTSSMTNGVLPDILRTFQEKYPEVKLILREENSAIQISNLRDRQTDIAFVYQDLKAENLKEDLESKSLKPEPFVVVIYEQHPFKNKSELSYSDLRRERKFIMPLPQHDAGLSPRIKNLCVEAGLEFDPNFCQEALFMVTILGLVAAKIGISILPASVKSLQRTGVIYKEITEQPIASQLTAVSRRDNSSTNLKNFIEIIQDITDKKL